MGSRHDTISGFSTAFSVLAHITVYSCLDSTMKWKRNSCLLGKHFLFDDGGPGQGGDVHTLQLDDQPPCLFFFPVSPSTNFPFSSLPPRLDAIWKQATFRDTPLGRKRIRRWLSRLSGSFSGHRARRVVVEAPPGGQGRRGKARSEGARYSVGRAWCIEETSSCGRCGGRDGGVCEEIHDSAELPFVLLDVCTFVMVPCSVSPGLQLPHGKLLSCLGSRAIPPRRRDNVPPDTRF